MDLRRAFAPLFIGLGLGVLGLGALGLGACREEVSRAPGTRVAVPAGLPVELDGRLTTAEWQEAARLPLGDEAPVLLVQQVRGTLLLALEGNRPWPRDGRLVLFLAPDVEGTGAAVPGAVRLDYEPREHNRPHLIATQVAGTGEEAADGQALARGLTDGPRPTVEIAIKTSWLGITAGITAGTTAGITGESPAGVAARGPGTAAGSVRLAALWISRDDASRATWPEGLDLFASRRPPVDYLDGARWGRLDGLAAGRGAWSESTWARLAGEDAEMRRRGDAAHAVALLIDEEPELRKKDREMVPDLVENLAWIAAREPLHPRDLLALATGYRFLNRGEEALAVLDAMAIDPVWGASESVRYQRARVLESRERWDEAVAAWRSVRDANAATAPRYEAIAARAEQRKLAWETERKAREEDLARGDLPVVLLRTNRGNLVIQVFADDVPKAAEHFLDLVERRLPDPEGGAERRTYDGTLFHRVLGDHLVQGGDPATAGGDCSVGGKGDGPRLVPAEVNPRHGFWRGAVGFARGLTRENGSQFFVLTSPRPELGEREFTCFGHVISGMDVADRLEQCDTLIEARILVPRR